MRLELREALRQDPAGPDAILRQLRAERHTAAGCGTYGRAAEAGSPRYP